VKNIVESIMTNVISNIESEDGHHYLFDELRQDFNLSNPDDLPATLSIGT